MAGRRDILGVRVDDWTTDALLTAIASFRASGEAHHIVTPNPEFVMIARRDPLFRATLARADAAPADGIGLRWAGWLLRQPIREVIPGSDLTLLLAEHGATRGERWFLLGARPGIAEAAGRELSRRYPGLVIAGTWSGSPRPDADDHTCALIEAVAPIDVLLVAYGAPQQDFWIERNQPRLGIPIAMGVGGTLDLLAGRNPQPPHIVKRLHLIWLFRLVTQPWRWRRQTALLHFVALVLATAYRQRRDHTTGTRSM
jgi:N-acetylglucosaminyldiphosphoundecaprenol N-acetyl-beta-D-mannosaminyltransferase